MAAVIEAPGYQRNLHAALLVAAAMTAFGISDAMTKEITATMPIGQLMALRGFVVVPVLWLLLRREQVRLPLVALFDRWNIVRAVGEALCAALFFASLHHLSLIDNTTLFFVAPIMVTAMAALILKEKVGPRRWTGVLVGFLGVIIAAGAPGATVGWVVLLPIASAFFSAARDIVTRKIDPNLPAAGISLVTALGVTALGWLSLPLGWVVPGWKEIGLLGVSSLLVTCGYQLYIQGIRFADISFVSPFRYVAIPVAALLGYIVWGDVPTVQLLIGGCIIVGSGLFIIYRERQIAKDDPGKEA